MLVIASDDFTHTNHRHSFSTTVALLCLEKMAGLWQGCTASLEQSIKCPEWEHFRKMCHKSNTQHTGDQPHRNAGGFQVSQLLPKASFSGSLPVGAQVKNVLLCFQHCHPVPQMGGIWGGLQGWGLLTSRCVGLCSLTGIFRGPVMNESHLPCLCHHANYTLSTKKILQQIYAVNLSTRRINCIMWHKDQC